MKTYEKLIDFLGRRVYSNMGGSKKPLRFEFLKT